MSHERFPRRTDLAIWLASLAFLGFAIEEAAGAAPATQATASPQVAVAAPPQPAPTNPRDAFQRECGDCHLAYPPRLLPAADWRRIVGTLDRHFGVDASLDAATRASLAAWLEANAGRARSGGAQEDDEAGENEGGRGREAEHAPAGTTRMPRVASTAPATPPAQAALSPLPRISTTPWFRREHDEIAASTWRRPAIGSAARCEACHTDAAQGRFSERAIRIPR